MSIQIKLKNSVVQDSTPSTSDLPAVGEIALNANINSIGGFMRASDNSIVKIFGPGSLSTPTATTTVSGISELATSAETTAGSATNRVVTPAGLNAVTVAERTTSNTNYVAKAGSTLTGVLTMPNGSNSAPAINFGDSDSGIFGGTNTVSLAAGGTTRLTADTGVTITGALSVSNNISTSGGQITCGVHGTSGIQMINDGTFGTIQSADLVLRTASTERARLDTSGRLLIGTTSSRAAGPTQKQLQIEGTNGASSSLSLIRNQSNTDDAVLYFAKTRHATVGGSTIVQDDDKLGDISFAGADGTDIASVAARIQAFVDGTPGSNDMPGRLVFSTTADGASSPTDRLTIDSTGKSTFTGNLTITNTQPEIFLQDSDSNSDFKIQNVNGVFKVLDATSNNGRFTIASDGTATFTQNLNALSGLDVTGTTNVTGQITVSQTVPILELRSTTTTTDNCKIRFGDASSAQRASLEYDLSGTNSLKFKMGGFGNNVDRMILTGDGKLGLGTTSPTYPTEITVSDTTAYSTSTTNSSQHQLRINNAGLGGVAGILLTAEPSSGSAGHAGIRVISPSSGNADMTFSVRDGGTYSEKLRILSSGNVGIGTSSPSVTLDIEAVTPTIRLTDSDASGTPECEIKGGGGDLVFSADRDNEKASTLMQFQTDGSTAMTIDSSQRVGIGTTSPSYKLEVSAETAISGDVRFLTGSRHKFIGGGSGNNLELGTYGNSNTSRNIAMVMDSAGRVGIGTSSPAVPLNVVAGGTDAALFESTESGANGVQLTLRHTSSSPADDDVLAVLDFSGKDDGANNTTYAQIRSHSRDVSNGSEDGDITFHTRSNGSFGERIRITSDGLLGIQAGSNTNALIDIQGNSENKNHIRLRSYQGGAVVEHWNGRGISNSTDTGRLGVGKNGNALIYTSASASPVDLFAIGNTDQKPLVFSTGNTERVRVDASSPTVLIGTTTTHGIGWTLRGAIQPSSCNYNSTDIRGFIDFSSFHSTGSAQSKIFLQSDGKIYARTTTIQAYSSERRTKKNIVALNLEKAWNTLRDTPFYTFNFKDEIEGTALHHGPIVDECPEDLILPTQKEDEVGVINTVNSEKLQYRAYSALQQALKRIEELETKVKALQAA